MDEQNFIDISDYLDTPTLEAFRVLSANLNFNKKKLIVIAVVSFEPAEGKTMVAINLAIAEAKAGNRVLYVDADLRKPKLLKRHGALEALGLTDFEEGTKLKDIACRTGIENLNYVASGNKLVEPVEFLSGPNFDRFIEVASQEYDMVFIDSSSMGKCVDSAIIAAKAAGGLVVTRSQKTKYKNIERIKWQMKNVGANIVGVVINRVEKRDFKSYFVLGHSFKYVSKNLRHLKLNN